ncbi:hypothetical protein BDW62DRAFT_204237 [Aspergillus aurantiobrunneus]
MRLPYLFALLNTYTSIASANPKTTESDYVIVGAGPAGPDAPRFPQGHVLGGGIPINFMSHSRGAASVYDQWASESGNDGLGFENLLEQFKPSTNQTIPPLIDYNQSANHSVYGNGPVQVSYEQTATFQGT